MGKQWVCTLVFVLIATPAIGAPKTDVVIFDNGDRLTGEIKSLERGRLRFKTDATDTISIEWDDIAYLKSDQNIQVETDEGARFLGHLSRADKEYVVSIQTRAGSVELESSAVILMSPIEEKGVSRLDGDITAGIDVKKASKIRQSVLGLEMDFRSEVRVISLEIESETSDVVAVDGEETESSQRQNLDLQYRRLLPNRWLAGGALFLERNDELDIDLRSSIAVGGGRILRQTNASSLILEGGLQLTRNNPTDPTLPTEDSVEAFGSARWDWFRFDTPELDLSTKFKVVPNLSETGQVRGELDISLKWELYEDLFWELSYDYFYEVTPLDDTTKTDYSVNTSLGWKF